MKVIEGNIELTSMNFSEIPEVLSDVDYVMGSFFMNYNRLKNLKNCPKSIRFGNVNFSNNSLTSLVGGLKSVGVDSSQVEHFIKLDGNKLTSLEGFPKLLGKPFDVYLGGNSLSTLGNNILPEVALLDLSGNPLTSLQGCPQKIGNRNSIYKGLSVADTNLKSMVGGPKTIIGYLDISYTGIDSIEGFPNSVDGALIMGGTPLAKIIRDNYSRSDIVALRQKIDSIFKDGMYENFDEYEDNATYNDDIHMDDYEEDDV